MNEKFISIGFPKKIALIAHDNKKPDLMEWIDFNKEKLVTHDLYATGTTGKIIQQKFGIHINRLQSGPLGGDLQMGSKISLGEIDLMVFFWDPLEPQPHDPDVKALLRIAVVWNIPVACNRATADFIFSSPLMSSEYSRQVPDFDAYMDRSM